MPMNNWNEIQSAENIADLLDAFGGFHDSCLVAFSYHSGNCVDQNNAMYFSSPHCHEATMLFHSQWSPYALELCFSGVRKFHIIGWQDNYFCEILDCFLEFCNNLIPNREESLIVWSDSSSFDPINDMDKIIINEPMTSYVIAKTLKWRFIEKLSQ